MRVRRVGGLCAAVILLACLILLIPTARTGLLRSAGWSLVAEDPIEPADVIVLTVDAQGAGALEAADLVRSGVARRVAVFDDPREPADQEFVRRGLHYAANAERTTRELHELGVSSVESIATVEGTESEAAALAPWCDRRNIARVIVVTPRDHSRRVRRVLTRTMSGRRTRVVVRAARFSSFDPDDWWRTRGGVRTEIVEMEKLLLDVVRHPLSR